MGTVTLPLVLAGPIVRSASQNRVTVWLCTSKPALVSITLSAEDRRLKTRPSITTPPPIILTSETGATVQVAANLHILVLDISAKDSTFPSDTTVYFDAWLQEAGGDLTSLDTLLSASDRTPWLYNNAAMPSFVIQRSSPLTVLHGSCRKLHGDGEDMTPQMDSLLSRQSKSPDRPTHMLLTGDQIYGDDVSPELLPAIRAIGLALVGDATPEQIPPFGDISSMSERARRAAIQACGYPRLEPVQYNHLLSFGEYAAIYLLTWSPSLWISALTFAHDVSQFKGWQRDAATARRMMANIVTHMICDDHEVTDDWNLSKRWRRDVRASDTGRRVIANGMFANWIFQVVPTLSPAAREDGFKVLREFISNGKNPETYERYIWDSGPFTYETDTTPPILMLDTRTSRQFLSGADLDAPPILLTDEAFSDLAKRLEAVNNAFIVSPSPVLDFRAIEVGKDFAASINTGIDTLLTILARIARLPVASLKTIASMLITPGMPIAEGPYTFDLESWSSSIGGTVKLFDALFLAGIQSATFISGDVHYGFAIAATLVAANGRRIQIRQLTSSAIRNMPTGSERLALRSLTTPVVPWGGTGFFSSTVAFWRTSPQTQLVDELNALTGLTGEQQKCVAQIIDAVNKLTLTGFINSHLSLLLGITQPPAYTLYTRASVDKSTGEAFVVVNNFGLIKLDGRGVRNNYLAYESQLHELDVSDSPVQ